MHRPSPPAHFEQPSSFTFTSENRKAAEAHIAKYPEGKQQSALMPILMLAQQQEGWVSIAAMEHIAELLAMPVIRVQEVATFYSQYNLTPLGTYHVQCCTTTPCWLRGSEQVVEACKDYLGIGLGESTTDGMFTLSEVECLGACVNAPMIQVNATGVDNFYEDLDYERTLRILKALKGGTIPEAGSQAGRQSSEPAGGPTTLANQREAWEKKRKAS